MNMRLNRRFHRSLGAAAALGLAGVGLSAVPAQAAEVQIDILATNDFHGRIEQDGQAAGAAVLAGAVESLRAENPNTVFAAAGDLIGASTFTSFIQQDNPTIDALSAAGLDVSAVGNHEFDQGYCDLIDRVIPRADWEYIGANVTVADGADTGCDTDTEIAPTWTEELGGVTVGFVGAVTEHLPELVSPSGIAALEVGDIVEATNESAAQLKADGADIVVLLVHEGAATTAVESATDPDSDFGAIVNGVSADVDAIVSGHTHLAYNHSIEVPEWAGREVTTRPVVSAGQYGFNLNKISFTWDTEANEGAGAVVGVESEILPLTIENDEGDFVPNPIYPVDGPNATEVSGIVAAAVDEAEELGAQKLGDITADFFRASQNATEDNANPENRGGESPLGNFVADVQLAAAQVTDPETQIAFMNPGGLRADLTYASDGENDPDGNVTYQEAALVQPFANTLVTTTLTGEQIDQVLEEQWQPEGAARPELKLGVSAGLTYTFDPAAAAGARVTSVELDGVPLDPAGEYRVVVNSFLASGGDNFATLAQGSNPSDSGQIDLQSMVDYLGANSPASPDYAQRSVGVTWVSDPAAVYTPGDEIAVDLSSLLFSHGEPADATATVTLGGVEVGTVDVDPAIVDTTDLVGRAEVRVTVPETLAAGAKAAEESALVVELAETGTTVTLPITLDLGDDGTDDGGDENGTDDGTENGADNGTDDGADDGGADDGDDNGADNGTDDGGELPDTGSSGVIWWVIGGVAVLAIGGALFAVSRRKGSAPDGGAGGSAA
ncbi:5'-nucleotidase C-terminal domain-containing protein [Jiangella mangrovi]|uniref:5'-nucleotidase C-terminal domain-containing protein n=1 Tax=Jiangella mangrovi TaxID=1524084 RepID=UPI001C86B8B8|nr:5'-nucleotidase C-terminal domain-containing protein [Jiangella mangrovi]